MVLGPKGERLDLYLSDPGLDWGGWFTDLAERGVRGLTTDDDLIHLNRVLLPSLQRLAWERPPEAGPVLLALWEAVMQGRVRLRPEVRKLLCNLMERWYELIRSQGNPKVPASTNRLEGRFGRFKPRARLTQGLKTEVSALHFARLVARSMT